MVKKKESMSFGKFMVILFAIGFVICTITITTKNEYKIKDLQEEIASMPHYECWNESFEGFVNKNETDELVYVTVSGSGIVRELCKLNRDVVLGDRE